LLPPTDRRVLRAAAEPVVPTGTGTEEILYAVTVDPTAELKLAVTGPGGMGKTTFLNALATRYDQSPRAGEDTVAGTALLVDDAHLLDGKALDSLARLAADPAQRIVVAYRPWPHPPELVRLAAVLGRGSPLIVLGRLDRDAVAARVATVLGCPPPPGLVDLLDEYTSGVPRLVDRLLTALLDTDEIDRLRKGNRATAVTVPVPPKVIEQFRPELDALDRAVRDVLLAQALDPEPDLDRMAQLTGLLPDVLTHAVDAAMATGWLLDDGGLVPLVRRAVLRLTPGVRLRAAQQRLTQLPLVHDRSLVSAGCTLLDTGARGSGVAALLEAAGDQAMPESCHLAGKFFAAAADAGAPPARLAARRAEAAALMGDLDAALRFTDEVLRAPETPDRVRGGLVAAAVLARRGSLSSSVELYRWLRANGQRRADAAAVPALIGVGQLAEAEAALVALDDADEAPTLRAGAERMVARGVYATIAGRPSAAVSQLATAADLLEPTGRHIVLADTPAALAAIISVHSGELATAEALLNRALTVGLGGKPSQVRHHLLRGWIVMLRGDLAWARAIVDQYGPRGARLEPRDELLAATIEVGVARRDNDLPDLSRAWGRARDAVVHHPVDLYCLQSFGEFAVAVAQLGEQNWLEPHLTQAWELLDRLGRPVLWTTPLTWFGLQAAIAAGIPADARVHADALLDAAGVSHYTATLATAARCWLDVLAGEIDTDRVVAAARALRAVGQSSVGTRIAAEAAIRTADGREMSSLLSCARSLAGPGSASPQTRASDADQRIDQAPDSSANGLLSPREVEVATLILGGLTYKQVGERLFITARTVEHHMARIRTRLGCASRTELLARLGTLLPGQQGIRSAR
jgi:DNA-binding NarL/FixJ family response regulator/GTPase SAR1 family protein